MRTTLANLLVAFAVTAAAVCFAGKSPAELSTYPDAESSIALAEGKAASVRLHHARRIFHPLVVAGLSRLTGMSIVDAFAAAGKALLFCFLFLVLSLLSEEDGAGLDRFAAACILLPFSVVVYELCFLQLGMFLFLTAAFIHAARRDNLPYAALILLCLILTREDGAILGLCAALAIWKARQPRTALFVFAAMLGLGELLIAVTSRGAANMHGSSYLLFSLARLPLFYARNLLGIEHWVDTYRALPSYTHPPLAAWPVPEMLRGLSNVREAGIYAWNPMNIVLTAAFLLGSFGILPVIALGLWRKRAALPQHWSFLALGLFGLIEFLLAPGEGTANIRYYLPAWPLFFWVLACAGGGAARELFRKRPALLALHLAAGWLLFFAARGSV